MLAWIASTQIKVKSFLVLTKVDIKGIFRVGAFQRGTILDSKPLEIPFTHLRSLTVFEKLHQLFKSSRAFPKPLDGDRHWRSIKIPAGSQKLPPTLQYSNVTNLRLQKPIHESSSPCVYKCVGWLTRMLVDWPGWIFRGLCVLSASYVSPLN